MHARNSAVAFLIMAAAQGMALPAQAAQLATSGIKRQLTGVSAEEADRLIGLLKHAQSAIKSGKPMPFELMSGSLASWKQSELSPRAAFLQIIFSSIWGVEFVPNDRSVERSYRLYYAPEGVGKDYWDITVNVGLSGNIERVALVYRSPSPF